MRKPKKCIAFDVSDNVAMLIIATLLIGVFAPVVMAALQDKPNAMQIVPILTGLIGTVVGYLAGARNDKGKNTDGESAG